MKTFYEWINEQQQNTGETIVTQVNNLLTQCLQSPPSCKQNYDKIKQIYQTANPNDKKKIEQIRDQYNKGKSEIKSIEKQVS